MPKNCKRLPFLWLKVCLACILSLSVWPFSILIEDCAAEESPSVAPVVRSIRIDLLEIFDEKNIGAFYRTVNKLKVSTQEEVIRREVLLKEGDVFDEFLLEESERNLRSLPFLRKISIIPIHDADFVDLIVTVQDTWTLYPFLNISSGGGTSKKSVGLTEANVLGYGKRFEILVGDDEGRDVVEGVWDDRRLFGSYHRLTLGHFQRSDGFRSALSCGRPFRGLVEPNAWSINSDISDLVGRNFEDGEESFIYRQEHYLVNGGYTWSLGDPEQLLRRYTLGYDYSRDDFDNATDSDFDDAGLDPNDPNISRDPRLLADDRLFSGPTLFYQRIVPDYLSINFVDRFERVQDFNLGRELNASVHVAPKSLGSIDDTFRFKFSGNDGWRTSPTSFLRSELGGSFRIDNGEPANSIFYWQLKYYNILGAKFIRNLYIGKHTLAAAASVDYGEKIDKDVQLVLGASNGLRGYEDRTFTGDQRLRVALEDRFHLVEDVFRLVSIGGTFFVDAGGTSTRGIGDIISDEMYANVGFGFRFGLTRSSGGAVVRLDIALPLRDGPDGSDRFEPRVLLTSGQAFSSRLRSESLSSQAARVSAGFLP